MMLINYNLPSNILNRDYFIKLLREGHAIKEARHVNPLMPSFYTIPFSYDDQNNMFVPYKDIKGNKTALIYKYLYFKLEMLLGPNFMDEWATNKNDTLLLKACELIDSKYGKGVFKTLYEGIQIIFLNLNCLPDDDLNKMIAGNNDLSNKDKGTCKFYKMIESTNYSACRIFLTNPNSLTEAIVSLEKLMTKCFTIDKQQSYQTDNYFSKKFQYYILNMGDKVFNYKIMGNIEKKINCLKIYADFMSNNKELDIDDSIKFK